MSFTVRKIKHRPWPVTVKLLESNFAGEVVEREFDFVLHFNALSESEYKAIFDELNPSPENSPASAEPQPGVEAPAIDKSLAALLANNARVFARVICGWSKVLDEHGEPLPYSNEALTAIVTGTDGLAISSGIHSALQQLRFGVAPAKNSPTSAAPGQTTEPAEVSTNSAPTSPPSA